MKTTTAVPMTRVPLLRCDELDGSARMIPPGTRRRKGEMWKRLTQLCATATNQVQPAPLRFGLDHMVSVSVSALIGARSRTDLCNKVFAISTSARRRHRSPGPVDPAALVIPVEKQMTPALGLVLSPAVVLILTLALEVGQEVAHFLADHHPSSSSDAWQRETRNRMDLQVCAAELLLRVAFRIFLGTGFQNNAWLSFRNTTRVCFLPSCSSV